MIDYKNFEDYKTTITQPNWAIHSDGTLEFMFPPNDGHEHQLFIQISPSNRMHGFNIYWDGQFDEEYQEPLTQENFQIMLGEIFPQPPASFTYKGIREMLEKL